MYNSLFLQQSQCIIPYLYAISVYHSLFQGHISVTFIISKPSQCIIPCFKTISVYHSLYLGHLIVSFLIYKPSCVSYLVSRPSQCLIPCLSQCSFFISSPSQCIIPCLLTFSVYQSLYLGNLSVSFPYTVGFLPFIPKSCPYYSPPCQSTSNISQQNVWR